MTTPVSKTKLKSKKKSRAVKSKRGRPKTGAESIHLRVLPEQAASVDAWIAKQNEVGLSRPEAIRRLVDLGLAFTEPRDKPTRKVAIRAAEMAAEVIDERTDSLAPPEEREQRKQRLLKGPLAFRDIRRDRLTKKQK